MQEVVLGELKLLMAQDPNGLLKTEVVVKAAEDPASPLHKYFTWDDTKAAARWRTEEAGQLIKAVSLYVEPLDIKVRAFTSLDIDRTLNGGYRLTTDVLADAGLRDQLLQTALREIKQMESRFGHLQELTKLWETTKDVEVSLDRRTKRKLRLATLAGAR